MTMNTQKTHLSHLVRLTAIFSMTLLGPAVAFGDSRDKAEDRQRGIRVESKVERHDGDRSNTHRQRHQPRRHDVDGRIDSRHRHGDHRHDRRDNRHYDDRYDRHDHRDNRHYDSRYDRHDRYGNRHYDRHYDRHDRYGNRHYDNRYDRRYNRYDRHWYDRYGNYRYNDPYDYRGSYSHGHYHTPGSWCRHTSHGLHGWFEIPRWIRHEVRHNLRDFYYDQVYYADHGHYHTIYRFPVYIDATLTYQPYAYCEGKFFATGYFRGSRPHFSFRLRF